MTPPVTRTWLQYTHLDKLYGYLPGVPAALPQLFGLSDDDYTAEMATFRNNARQAAERLLTNSALTARVDALPFRPQETVLIIGDSITDDAQSWAEILRHLLDQHRPQDHVTVINNGLSAHTTAMILRRWPATLTTKPDWILCLLGNNDITRVGPEPTKPQVSHDESIANLRELRRIAAAHTTASWVWLTPAPLHEERAAHHPAFRYGQASWRNTDLTALTTTIIRTFEDPVIDLTSTFGVPANPRLQGPDGVHPCLDGQAAITAALVEHLTDTPQNA